MKVDPKASRTVSSEEDGIGGRCTGNHMKTRREDSGRPGTERGLSRNQSRRDSDLRFPASETVKKKHACCLRAGLWCLTLAAPANDNITEHAGHIPVAPAGPVAHSSKVQVQGLRLSLCLSGSLLYPAFSTRDTDVLGQAGRSYGKSCFLCFSDCFLGVGFRLNRFWPEVSPVRWHAASRGITSYCYLVCPLHGRSLGSADPPRVKVSFSHCRKS